MSEIHEKSPFEKAVKKRLIDLGKSQTWLCGEITARTGLCVDSGYLCKIYNGKRNAPKIVAAICEILSLPEPKKKSKTKAVQKEASK